MTPDKRVELKNKLEELAAINYNLYLAGTVQRADTGKDWGYDQAVDEIVDFITQHHQDMVNEVVEKLEGMKTDERKVVTFGEWQAETYEDKELVNAVLTEAQTIIKSK